MKELRVDRREFVASVASAVPAAALAACADPSPPAAGPGTLDHDLLMALANAVLPTELGAAGIERVTAAFVTWLAGYRPLAERPHGYGTEVIERLPSNPAPAWAAQLVALDTAARERFSRPLAALSADRAADIVRSALTAEQIDPMPAPIEAGHVALGLLAYFYQSPEAADLCYRASIGRYRCRPLASSPALPDSAQLGDHAS